MKHKILTILFTLVGLSTFCGCNDWLNVQPKDSMLEEQLYSSELKTNSVLNGIYRSIGKNTLYGENLSQTYIEYLAHYYNYMNDSQSISTDLLNWNDVSRFQYNTVNVKGKTQGIWNDAYATILSINIFIENVSKSDVVRENRKNVLLGEAYGLRAFLHFDMFRLFGPIYKLNPQAEAIPYNVTPGVSNHLNETASNFLDLVLKDLAKAEELLQNDPIRKTGVNDDYEKISSSNSLTVEDRFAEYYRNRRMNFYAIKALKARVLLWKGDHTLASQTAAEVLNEVEEKAVFKWETDTFAKQEKVQIYNNYIFYREVLFGINNLDLHKNWNTLFNEVKPGLVHVVLQDNLYRNIYTEYGGMEITSITDIRGKQWQTSNVVGISGSGSGITYVSKKYRKPSIENWKASEIPYLIDFQPMIRMSELYYIQAEAAIADNNLPQATEKINIVMAKRGVQKEQMLNPATASLDEVMGTLEREYYREFVGEGQAFYFLKRTVRNKVFGGYKSGYIDIIPEEVYVVPLPDSETIIN
jgi:hypothetical protein